jgi:aryl-alcohol dehydrogenase-like predicted oxidoreductase
MSKLGIGTVQFGLDYGVNNKLGRINKKDITDILKLCKEKDISTIDTAPIYGESEKSLGNGIIFKDFFSIVTKTEKCKKKQFDKECVEFFNYTFNKSLINLRTSSVYGLLVHDPNDLLKTGSEMLYEWLVNLKKTSKVKKIGISAYSPKIVDKIISRYEIDLIQIPFNILDRRISETGLLKRIKAAGIEVHSRSPFLQGLLLMNPKSFPNHFNSVKGKLNRYHDFIRDHDIDPVTAALSFCLKDGDIDVTLCGVDNLNQAKQLSEVLNHQEKLPSFDDFIIDDLNIIEPYRWKV